MQPASAPMRMRLPGRWRNTSTCFIHGGNSGPGGGFPRPRPGCSAPRLRVPNGSGSPTTCQPRTRYPARCQPRTRYPARCQRSGAENFPRKAKSASAFWREAWRLALQLSRNPALLCPDSCRRERLYRPLVRLVWGTGLDPRVCGASDAWWAEPHLTLLPAAQHAQPQAQPVLLRHSIQGPTAPGGEGVNAFSLASTAHTVEPAAEGKPFTAAPLGTSPAR